MTAPDFQTQAERLADLFGEALCAELGLFKYRLAIDRNRANPDASWCASHDFCDANMVMLSCWQQLTGADDVPEDDDCALWNAAWDIWRARGAR